MLASGRTDPLQWFSSGQTYIKSIIRRRLFFIMVTTFTFTQVQFWGTCTLSISFSCYLILPRDNSTLYFHSKTFIWWLYSLVMLHSDYSQINTFINYFIVSTVGFKKKPKKKTNLIITRISDPITGQANNNRPIYTLESKSLRPQPKIPNTVT